jgi:uncharacterized DUF497 family protein
LRAQRSYWPAGHYNLRTEQENVRRWISDSSSFTKRGEAIRLISARKATRRERWEYEQKKG